ncbi:Gfo/Idh/MocA family protein [Desulfomonile tiedjei]|uniref:Putative dehydrogenase n=1 Tax=Desulfomonile tiedjei (strain ATCC 49306 / DSM 6799 / DCB-1) TaxID=706587 RepID=I4C7F5_DESTA|nr:Gfo/Idh/MocA family oxidoreductase [Desulfomonile tiedjei]AFM25496.1 putative dehydrogenase [Desulfomonile tiedjei DSM 6799]
MNEDHSPAIRHAKILVAGSGSIGRRHMRNLHGLGAERLFAVDPDPERLVPVKEELGVIDFSDYSDALEKVRPDVVFVCSPPVYHVQQTREALQAGAHVFVEKPLSHDFKHVDDLILEAKNSHHIVQVGYNLRFHPGFRETARLLSEGHIGRVLYASAHVAQYLPDWRPWQDYRLSYTARKELGGGIILDASHEIDYIIDLLKKPVAVACMAGTVGDLQVDVEDCATILLRFSSGAQADIHMDFLQRDYARSCRLVGEKGTIIWDYGAAQVRLFRSDSEQWQTIEVSCDPNDMYVEEVRDFLACILQGRNPLVGLEQAALVLKTALAAKSAAEKGIMEKLQ